jgi:hypothetical protein
MVFGFTLRKDCPVIVRTALILSPSVRPPVMG